MLRPTWIAKVADALHLLAEIGLHGEGLEDGSLQLLVLKVRREWHVLEGQHQQVARLVSHGQRTAAVGESGRRGDAIGSFKEKTLNSLEGGVEDVGVYHRGGHRLHGAIAQVPDVHGAATERDQDGGVSAAPAGAVHRGQVMLKGHDGQQDSSQPDTNAPDGDA